MAEDRGADLDVLVDLLTSADPPSPSTLPFPIPKLSREGLIGIDVYSFFFPLPNSFSPPVVGLFPDYFNIRGVRCVL